MPPSWLSRLSIGQKLALSFGLIVIVLIGSFSATLVYLSRVNSYVDRHQRITIPGVVTASGMLRDLSDMQIHMHHLLEHQDAGGQAISLNAIAEIEHRTLSALDIYQTNHAARTHPVLYGMLQHHGRGDLADEENRTIVAIADGISALRAQREDIETASRRRTKPPAETESLYEQTAAKIADAIASLIDIHRKIDVEMKIEGDRLVEQARLIVFGVVGLLGILVLTTYLMMKQLVANPLKRLAATADRVAHHDLTAQFEPWPTRDEVGVLANSLTAMLANLRERGTALTRKTKELEAFTYSIAHDLKGPLREIEGFSSLLEKRFQDTSDPQTQHHIDVIRRSALRLTHMIDALLTYSRLEQQNLPRSRFNVLEMINGLLADRQSQLTGIAPQITLNLPFADLYGEPVSIRQALVNLLDNAIKFSRLSPASSINIGGQQTPTERILWIQDNGIGFDADQKEKLFGLFERLHNAQEYEGTGVGLAIVKMVMEKHGGRAWADSSPGTGSTFFLAFPNGQEAVSRQLSASSQRQPSTLTAES
ncbi:MAG: HAMP domain-containing protein [Nitrospira sp.]|nr:HAMP domain-containing protein [Nitrospira sp.]